MTNKIIVDDGSKTYTVENKRGEKLFDFVFFPTDVNIIDRYKNVQKFFDTFQVSDDMTEEDIAKLQDTLIEQMDYLTGADTKNTFFSVISPFSPMADGKLFMETCLDVIADVINKEFDANIKKSQKRIEKYTKQYHG